MGFIPTTTVPNPEAYAIKWREEITKALENYFKQSEWISVEERLPEHLEKVLVYDEMGNMNTAIFLHYDNGNVDWCTSVRLNRQVTHWMPLPEAPKMKGGGE